MEKHFKRVLVKLFKEDNSLEVWEKRAMKAGNIIGSLRYLGLDKIVKFYSAKLRICQLKIRQKKLKRKIGDLDNYWCIGGNYWGKDEHTEAEAIAHAKGMKNCKNCVDCYDCISCEDCYDCMESRECFGCISCDDCECCKDCENCTSCMFCNDCEHCNYCKNCNDCESCIECEYCNDCDDCEFCKDCENCYNLVRYGEEV